MFGSDGELARAAEGRLDASAAGIAVRACCEVLELASGRWALTQADRTSTDSSAVTASVSMQYIEIYQNNVTDLLTGRPVHVSAFGEGVVLAGVS